MPNSAALSRRTVLTGSAAGLVLPSVVGSANAENCVPPLEFSLSTSSFSVAERDRRWAAVRANMAKPQWNLDAIITVGSDAGGNAARYLTQVGSRPGGDSAPEVVFPRDASRPVHVQAGSSRNRDRRKANNAWIADGKLLITADDGPENLAKVLAGYGLDRKGARIGIATLSGSRFNPDGSVSVIYLDHIKTALPGAVFIAIDQWGSDSGPIEEAGMLKGPEEQAVVRRIIAAAEQGLAAMVSAARAGAKQQADLWFAAYSTMFARTGEDPSRLSIALDSPGNTTLGEPTGDPVKPGQIVTEEIEASIQGYRAQINHSIFLGGTSTPGYDYYRSAMETAATLLQEAPSWVVPGKTTCGDFVRRYIARLQELGGEDTSGVSFHSSGIGNLTRPRVGLKNSVKDHDIVIRPGMTFDFKPAFRLSRTKAADIGAANRDVQLGEHFLVTEQGMTRLGSRSLIPWASEA
jgi:Xaa-Pro aminopeptidase